MSKGKKISFGRVFNIIGTVVLVAMLSIASFNFTRDARVFQRPLLSTADSTTVKDSTGKNADDYKTLKYKKLEPASSKSDKNISTAKKSSSSTAKPKKSGTIPNSNP